MHPYVAVPATVALVYRAYSRKSLTPLGIVVAALTAIVHAIHPWSLPFALLGVFFLAGTAVTKVLDPSPAPASPYPEEQSADGHLSMQVKHEIKARLTLSSNGSSGGEGARTSIQVLANSAVASVLILLHYRQLQLRAADPFAKNAHCWAYGTGDLLMVGIIRHENLLPIAGFFEAEREEG